MADFHDKLQGYEIVSMILQMMVAMVEPGVKTIEIDQRAEDLIEKFKATSCNKGYYPKWADKPYPNVSCININNTIVHGIPGEDTLNDGDIVTFDLGIIDSFGNAADAAITVGVGKISFAKQKLLYYAYQTMMQGIKYMTAGANTQTIARIIQSYAYQRGFRVNRRFGGHAIGKKMHEKPAIYNTTEEKHQYAVLEEEKIYCIEPMLTNGNDAMGIMDTNGWTARTGDGKPSAVYEHMVKVTKDGPQILTTHIIEPPVF